MNKSFVEVLNEHLKMYPLMQEEDIYKLAHQSFFGPAHYIDDASWANKYIKVEAESSTDLEVRIIEIGGGYYRYSLVNDEKYLNSLCEAFIESANEIREDKDGFRELLDEASKALKDKDLKNRFTNLVKEMATFDYPAISHSHIYRSNYHPHYRIVKQKYIDKIILPK